MTIKTTETIKTTDLDKLNTNGTTPDTDTSTVLDKLNKEFVTSHKGKTTPKRVKELVLAFLSAQTARDKADAAAAAAAVAESDAAKSIIREVSGKQKVTIAGKLYSPMSRKDHVFFRKESSDTLDLG